MSYFQRSFEDFKFNQLYYWFANAIVSSAKKEGSNTGALRFEILNNFTNTEIIPTSVSIKATKSEGKKFDTLCAYIKFRVK